MTINSVRDVLQPGESALVIFTRDRELTLRPDGSGFTGNWVLDPRRRQSRVVIYNRTGANADGGEIISALHWETTASTEPGRFVVAFKNSVLHGRTDKDWKEFAGTGQNPIRYIDATQQDHAADERRSGARG